MQCPICGKDNQPGTRFCVHCGAAQTPVQPAATTTSVIAAMAQAEAAPTTRAAGRPGPAVDAPISPESTRASVAPAAAAAAATSTTVRPAATSTTLRPAAATPTPPPAAASLGTDEPAAPPDTPAYNAAPARRSGMLVVIALAVLGLIGIGTFIALKVSEEGGTGAGKATTAEAPAQPPASSSQTAPASPGAATPPSADTTPAKTEPVPAPAPEAKAPEADTGRAAPTGVTPSPAIEPPAKGAPKPAATRPPQPRPATTPKASEPAVQPPAAAPAPAPSRAPSTAAPRPASTPDRWAQMEEELARCTREDFIRRVVCDQRVRLRYCEGYWNRVPQCPGGSPSSQMDHGQ